MAPGSATRYTGRMRGVCAVWAVALICAAAAPAMTQPVLGAEPWLGVIITPGLRGVHVREVIDDSPAARAGLVMGDEILAVGAERVTSPAELIAALDKHAVGSEIELAVWRAGRLAQVGAILDAKPSEDEILHRRLVGKRAPGFRAPAVSGVALGDLSSLRGRVVVLAFAGPRCSACASLHRRLSRFVDRNPAGDLAVLVVSREPREVLDTWSRELRPSFTVLQDVGGIVARDYYVTLEPTLVVIDRGSEILYAGIGEETLDIALSAAERALDRGAI